jgi:hypothetical protein
MWWTVQTADRAAALAQVPPCVTDRTVADEVREVPIPWVAVARHVVAHPFVPEVLRPRRSP